MNDLTYVGRYAAVYSISRHEHENWEFIYCTSGSGVMRLDGLDLPYSQGDVVIIPPHTPHENLSAQGFTNVHAQMADPCVSFKEPTVVHDDGPQFLLNAFSAAFYHYYSDSPERFAFLSCYGSLISSYLAAYQTDHSHSSIVDDVERAIISHLTDCDFKLDAYFASLPFSDGYIRKLFQKEFAVTPLQYLTDKRLQMAAEALMNADPSQQSVGDIALRCGFRDPLYFSKLFKKKYGIAPSHFPDDGPQLRRD